MERRGKLLIKIVVLVVAIWIIFVTVDCIRLRNGELGTTPAITIGSEQTENRIIYKGLGYSIKYYYDIGESTQVDGVEYIEQLGYGAEFRLFDALLIWAWVE